LAAAAVVGFEPAFPLWKRGDLMGKIPEGWLNRMRRGKLR
jgi:hypothetical protein